GHCRHAAVERGQLAGQIGGGGGPRGRRPGGTEGRRPPGGRPQGPPPGLFGPEAGNGGGPGGREGGGGGGGGGREPPPGGGAPPGLGPRPGPLGGGRPPRGIPWTRPGQRPLAHPAGTAASGPARPVVAAKARAAPTARTALAGW